MADKRSQGGNGMACSRARARLNWVSQDQRRDEIQSGIHRRHDRFGTVRLTQTCSRSETHSIHHLM